MGCLWDSEKMSKQARECMCTQKKGPMLGILINDLLVSETMALVETVNKIKN